MKYEPDLNFLLTEFYKSSKAESLAIRLVAKYNLKVNPSLSGSFFPNFDYSSLSLIPTAVG